jgi:hypothetical protein
MPRSMRGFRFHTRRAETHKMKTERRHELQQNALADVLTEWIEAVKPYSTAILGGIIAVLVLIGVAAYLSQQAAQQQEVAWDDVFVNPEPSGTATPEDQQRLRRDRLLGVADEYGDSPAGLYARLTAAESLLTGGIDHLFEDKAKGTDELREAIKHFTQVLEVADEPLFVHKATLGLARAHESLNELPKAREYYQKLIDQKGVFSHLAEARLKDLDRTSTKDFYDWFAQQQPVPRANTLPGIPGLGPEFGFPSSSTTPSDIDFSDPFNRGKTEVEKDTDSTATETTTPAAEQPPAEQPPASSTEPASTPAAPDKK